MLLTVIRILLGVCIALVVVGFALAGLILLALVINAVGWV